MPRNGKMLILARTFKEFNRVTRFGMNKNDLVWKWLNWLPTNEVIYDIGSANGFRGFSAAHLNNCRVYFIEPYTPSIETILKTVSLTKINKPDSFLRLYMLLVQKKKTIKNY